MGSIGKTGKLKPHRFKKKKLNKGEFGRKTGKGFYKY